MDPGTQININIPQPGSSDPIEIKARDLFDQFPPGLQRALESGQLDKVNEVLGKMSVEEAEEVVEKLGDGGMLSLERGVIDGTTEEGRERLAELERGAHETGELVEGDENVNETLGEVSVKEAEKLGSGGMLSIDGTTKEARDRLAELLRESREKGERLEEIEGEPGEEALNIDDEGHGGVQLKGRGKGKEKAPVASEIPDPD